MSDEMEQKVQEILPFVCRWSFRKEACTWITGNDTIAIVLVDAAWDHLLTTLCISGRTDVWSYIDEYAGDLYQAAISLDGEDICVTISEVQNAKVHR